MRKNERVRADERVILIAIPPGLLDGLWDEDQRAITAIVEAGQVLWIRRHSQGGAGVR